MAKVDIDKDTFKHALTNLNKIEIIQIIQYNKMQIDVKDTKENIIKKLMNLLDEQKISEETYLAIKGKAFSVNKNFYDGFFYQFDKELCKFEITKLLSALKNAVKIDTKKVVKIIHENIDDNRLCFTCEITTSKPIYDSVEEKSRYFQENISADVDIFFNEGLIYIHSKNITESKKIKTFIQNAFNIKELLGESTNKVTLNEPTFNIEIAEKWINENKEVIGNRYSPFTIHMLDLLEEFNNGKGTFSSLSLKSIYFKHDIIDTNNDDAEINELQYGGKNLQRHYRIKEELKEGKKITGFKFEITHNYIDEDTEDEKYSILPIVILYEKKYALRISICTENVSAKDQILYSAYRDIKQLFMKKYKETNIINGELILNYLKSDYDNCNSQTKEVEGNEDEGWVFNG